MTGTERSSLYGLSNGGGGGGEGASSVSSSPTTRQPNYTLRRVREALEHLASIDPIELCNEAKVEHCRATRDLRKCGRYVQSVLNSCGHASLCEECSQRCDVCPICRIPLAKDGNRLRLRLYYECIEACIISKRCDDRLQDGEKELIADVHRLYALFDVALENNLSSLICHYVTDVCMDESAVSSDPVIAFLLDEVVVKDWCKRTFKSICVDLQMIYKCTVKEMEEYLTSLLKLSAKLSGLANVIEVLESSIKGSLSAKLQDLDHLQDCILRTKQHLEVMIWCIRHRFLEDVTSRHANIASWKSVVLQRKIAARNRAWPDLVANNASESYQPETASLFIVDALSNIDKEQGYRDDDGEELQIAYLQKDQGALFFRSKIEGLAGVYPFESLRTAVDVLFLQGSSDLVVSKLAILLYYLFDRHWTLPEESWKEIVNDFAATFSITRHSLLESFVFYLLDDHTDEALKETYPLLPEISGPTIHPKVARVLLERQNPDAALMVLRWSGRDVAQLVSLEEAVTTVRVRVECGLLTEAFMYQRAVCMKIKENNLNDDSFHSTPIEVRDKCCTSAVWVEALVTEICFLCIRRNLVDRMIELPWNSDEEKHIHKCLFDFCSDDPSSIMGSLLVVFYLQRYRYIDAYQVDRKLQGVEQEFISKGSVSDQIFMRMRSISHWRTGLVDQSIELLPDTIQQQLKNGELPQVVVFSNKEVDSGKSAQEPVLTSLLAPPVNSSLANVMGNGISPAKSSVFDTLLNMDGPANVYNSNYGNHGGYIPPANWSSDAEKGQRHASGLGKNFNSENIQIKAHHAGPSNSSPISQLNGSSTKTAWNFHLQNGSVKKLQNSGSNFPKEATNPVTPLRSNQAMSRDFAHESNMPNKFLYPEITTTQLMPVSDVSMDISWSHGKKGLSTEVTSASTGPRWRSDDDSDEEQWLVGGAAYTRNTRRRRRGRLMR